jgi:hypothetical protein
VSDTEITQSISSENPADNGTLEGLNDFLQDKMYLHLEKVIPGIVQSYDNATNTATIKPAITGVATQGAKVPKDILTNIPVLQLGGIIKFPVAVGMTGWLIACDRDISIFKSIKQETAPNTPRKHKYQDSFFIPDSINATVNDELTIDMTGKPINFIASTLKVNNVQAVADDTYTIGNGTQITTKGGLITAIT